MPQPWATMSSKTAKPFWNRELTPGMRGRYSADDAFRDLAQASQKANRKLNQVAADPVAQTTTPVAKSTLHPSANGHRYLKERRNSA
jgi:hypothetical protein